MANEPASGLGIGTFKDLDDTPGSLAGKAGKAIIVNDDEETLGFQTLDGLGAMPTLQDVTDEDNTSTNDIEIVHVVVESGEEDVESVVAAMRDNGGEGELFAANEDNELTVTPTMIKCKDVSANKVIILELPDTLAADKTIAVPAKSGDMVVVPTGGIPAIADATTEANAVTRLNTLLAELRTAGILHT